MDITHIFKSKTRQALFQLYFTNPLSAYYLRELERLLNIPVSIIRKELVRLEKEGLFLSKRRGNLLFFYLNKDYPLFNELKNIVRKTIGIEGLLRQVINSINGIEIAFIYGSFAKNKEKPTSDIDLLIVGNIDEDELISKINQIEKSIKREINYVLFSPKEFRLKRKNKDVFIQDILKNKKIMLKGKIDEL